MKKSLEHRKKITLDDISVEQFEQARGIVHHVIEMQSGTNRIPDNIMLAVLSKILSLGRGTNFGLDSGLRDGLYNGLHFGLSDGLRDGLHDGLHDGLRDELSSGLDSGLRDGLNDGLRDGLDTYRLKYCGIFWSRWLADYLIAAQWGCPLDWQKLGLLYAFCRDFSLVLQHREDEKRILCIKPHTLRWNIAGKTEAPFEFPIYELHSEDGSPTVECVGMKPLYFFHNVKLPEYIGRTRPADWKPEWILLEKNAEIRRCLLKEIPNEKIVATLQPRTIDTWREYKILRFDSEETLIPTQMLEMTCPSTSDTHILKIPPNITKAREAITWVNHGIDPEAFIIEH